MAKKASAPEGKAYTLADFRPQARNTNKHTQRGMGMLETSLGEGGWIGAMTSAADGEVFDGSARLETAYSVLPENPIIVDTDGTRPVILRRTDIPNAQDPRAVQLGILANRVAEANLSYDPNFLLEAEETDAIALTRFFSQEELDAIFNAQEPQVITEDSEEAVEDDIEDLESGDSVSRVSIGEIWQLGRHRLYCGDSTDKTALAILFADEKADCCWTEPPYGAASEGSKPQDDQLASGEGSPLERFLKVAFDAIATVALQPGSPVYVLHPAGPRLQLDFMGAFMHAFSLRQQLIWVKQKAVMGRSDYHYRHEPILMGYAPGGEGRRGRGSEHWYGDNCQDSIFEVERPTRNRDHPLLNPPELIQKMLANSAGPRSLIFDPFLGSGSTMVAAHTMIGSRRVYGCELDPIYAEVILRRYERLTGEEPQRIEVIGGSTRQKDDELDDAVIGASNVE